jgi:hypothetical protein
MNFASTSKKVCERDDETGHAFLRRASLRSRLQSDFSATSCCAGSPAAQFAEKMPSHRRIS